MEACLGNTPPHIEHGPLYQFTEGLVEEDARKIDVSRAIETLGEGKL